jgi:hypothetical protein
MEVRAKNDVQRNINQTELELDKMRINVDFDTRIYLDNELVGNLWSQFRLVICDELSIEIDKP